MKFQSCCFSNHWKDLEMIEWKLNHLIPIIVKTFHWSGPIQLFTIKSRLKEHYHAVVKLRISVQTNLPQRRISHFYFCCTSSTACSFLPWSVFWQFYQTQPFPLWYWLEKMKGSMRRFMQIYKKIKPDYSKAKQNHDHAVNNFRKNNVKIWIKTRAFETVKFRHYLIHSYHELKMTLFLAICSFYSKA
jgi:hypothetical protein